MCVCECYLKGKVRGSVEQQRPCQGPAASGQLRIQLPGQQQQQQKQQQQKQKQQQQEWELAAAARSAVLHQSLAWLPPTDCSSYWHTCLTTVKVGSVVNKEQFALGPICWKAYVTAVTCFKSDLRCRIILRWGQRPAKSSSCPSTPSSCPASSDPPERWSSRSPFTQDLAKSLAEFRFSSIAKDFYMIALHNPNEEDWPNMHCLIV